ncbi:MAG: transcriptional regulator [Acidimicrobiia bacterium]|nr:transcriptional regulator [Acidimicrobiia bacterium]
MSDTAVPLATSVPTRVLVLGMAHADGIVDAAEVFGVAEACGLSADQVRSCLRRLVTEGLFERDGTGRGATYVATEEGHRALTGYLERTRLAYAQDHAGRGWDRQWHLVAFAVPESQRPARDGLRDHLLALGGAAVHNGLYVSPHRWEADVTAEAERLGVGSSVAIAATEQLSVGGESDPRALARRLWPVDELAERYRQFVDAHAYVPDFLDGLLSRHERMTDDVFLSGALTVTVQFQSVFNGDPLLPPELLPRPWPGRAARELLLRSRRTAMRLRTTANRPALFRTYDELIESIP